MKPIVPIALRAAAVCLLLTLPASGLAALVTQQYGGQARDQTSDKKKQSGPPEAEQKEMAKIEAAPDVAAKIAAAGEFVKKYPKSAMRAKVVAYVAQEASKIEDGAQRITHLESAQAAFKEPADAEVLVPILVEAYFAQNRFDDLFRVASDYLMKNPTDLALLTRAALIGIEQAKQRNPKFAAQSQQFGLKAIEIIESGKKPEAFDDQKWPQYQTRWLPLLYQQLGMLAILSGNSAEARTRVDKAVALDSKDPFTFVLLGSLLNDEYQKLAEQHKSLAAGPMKDSVLKQAHAKLDEIVEVYAHAVGLSEGNPVYQQLHDQILQDLQSYYKYRHGGSVDGLQQLIDKYKP
jgi:hypothetical protein